MQLLKRSLNSERLYIRIITMSAVSLILFHSVTIISYYLLPDGLLLGKNSVFDWENSSNLFLSAIQIFAFNLISVVIVVIANFFPFPDRTRPVAPMGYWCLFIMYTLNGLTLGTWSFTAVTTAAPEISARLLRTFDIFNRAGIWEMMGQLIIASATARIAITKKEGVDVYNRKIRESRLTKSEIVTIIFGGCLMLAGAFIESSAIIVN